MAEAEAILERAERARRAQERDQKQRLRWTAGSAASYALDVLLLALFAFAGTIPGTAVFVYAAGAALVTMVQSGLYASGANLRFRDPSLTAPLVVAGVAVQLVLVAVAPQVAFPFLANLFTVFAFGVIWMSLRASALVWALTFLATGGVLWFLGPRVAIAVSTPSELALTWISFTLILGRCLLLSVYANDLRTRLTEGRRRLAASLEQIRELVHYDELTRCYNRRTLIERLEQERGRAERTGVPFSIALFDLDRFKQVNDSHGHAAGDEMLKAFADTVRATMRDSDVFGRYGGEEFLLILNGTAPAAARAALERIHAGLAAHDWGAIVPGATLTASIGVAGFRAGESVAQLVHRADVGMYEAKAAGRNCVIVKE
jgi:diguanylate cyclase (GGDEF)-like protein